MRQFEQQKAEITYGFSEMTSQASRGDLEAVFARMNGS